MSFTPAHLRPEAGLSFSLFPSNLRFLRKRKGLNQEDISALFNKKANTVGNWENGKSEPSIPELLVISGYFGVNLEDLLRSEMRQRQADSEKQLSLWPESLEKLTGISPEKSVPAESRKITNSFSADPDSGHHFLSGASPSALMTGTAPQTKGSFPAPLSASPGASAPSGKSQIPAQDTPEQPGAPTSLPGGDAMWFMLRELRNVQERLDRLQSAFDHSATRKLTDKSDH